MGEGVVVNDGDLITFTTAEDILELPKSIHEIQKFNDVNPGERIYLMTES
jgi:pyruvate kinase